MGTFTATTTAAEAPEIEPGIYDLKFTGTTAKTMKGGKFQKNPEGDPKLEWGWIVLDDDGDEMYDKGDPIELSVLTGIGFNIASKTVPAEVKMLKALCTKAEFQAFEAGEGVTEEDLIGRIAQGEVFVKENGWPGVTNVIPARKARAARKTASTDEDE